MFELNIAEDSQVNIAEPRPDQGVARHIAIGATGTDTSRLAGTIGCERSSIEPRRQHTVGGANPAAVWIEFGANGRNRNWGDSARRR